MSISCPYQMLSKQMLIKCLSRVVSFECLELSAEFQVLSSCAPYVVSQFFCLSDMYLFLCTCTYVRANVRKRTKVYVNVCI